MEALKLFGERRTHNGQGVTIPSQQRYVGYYDRMVHGTAPKVLTKSEWMLSKVGFGPVLVGGCSPCFTVVVNGTTVFKSADHMKVTTYYDSDGADATPDRKRATPTVTPTEGNGKRKVVPHTQWRLAWTVGRSRETSQRDPSGAGARAWRATSGCSLTGWKNDFQRFPTHVAVARASEFVLGKGASA